MISDGEEYERSLRFKAHIPLGYGHTYCGGADVCPGVVVCEFDDRGDGIPGPRGLVCGAGWNMVVILRCSVVRGFL